MGFFGNRKKPGAVNEDRSGTKTYTFAGDDFKPDSTRGEISSEVERILEVWGKADPLKGAEILVEMFSKNRELIQGSRELQDIFLGTGERAGPIAYLLGQAAAAKGSDSMVVKEKYKSVSNRYADLVKETTDIDKKDVLDSIDQRPFPRILRGSESARPPSSERKR